MRWVVVFDTNILLSALLSPQSNPSKCLKLAKTDIIQSITCQEIIDEFGHDYAVVDASEHEGELEESEINK